MAMTVGNLRRSEGPRAERQGRGVSQGVLKMGQQVEIRPGILSKDSEGKASCIPIYSRIVSLFAESNELQYAVPGGLIGVGTTVLPPRSPVSPCVLSIPVSPRDLCTLLLLGAALDEFCTAFFVRCDLFGSLRFPALDHGRVFAGTGGTLAEGIVKSVNAGSRPAHSGRNGLVLAGCRLWKLRQVTMREGCWVRWIQR